MCDMRWEVRDSTVEFLGHLAKEHRGVSASEAMLSRSWIKSLLKVALQDTESYVRASAIAALAGTLTQSCQQGASDEVVEIASHCKQRLRLLVKFSIQVYFDYKPRISCDKVKRFNLINFCVSRTFFPNHYKRLDIYFKVKVSCPLSSC